MPEPTLVLSDEEIARYRNEGYLALNAVTTQDEVRRIREIYDRIFAAKSGRETGAQFDLAGTDEDGKEAVMPQILGPANYAPELNDTLLLANVRAICKQLFGPAADANFAHAIFKPARISPQTPWHQDASYWGANYDYPDSVSVWVPLQPATIDNGCMWFVPRSHRSQEILPHRSVNDDPRIHALELQPKAHVNVVDPVACPLPPGGATLHGGYMLHYTGPNVSDTPRRAIILGGGLPAVKREIPRDLPWQAEKRTLRAERAKRAAEAGSKVDKQPEGSGR